MIQANEIKVGNIFHNNSSGLNFTVTKENISDVLNNLELKLMSNPPKDIIVGVPLTEEILLKCGFKRNTYQHFEFGEYVYFTYEIDCNYELSINIGKGVKRLSIDFFDGDKNSTVPINNIKYLHQLQNLYFALTNQELQINL